MATPRYDEETMIAPFAACMLVRRHGLILAVSRHFRPRDLGLPGGKIDPGESPRMAAIRELYEETGVVARSVSTAPVFDAVDDTGHRVLTFEALVDVRIVPREMEEGARVEWVSVERLVRGPASWKQYNLSLFTATGDLVPSST